MQQQRLSFLLEAVSWQKIMGGLWERSFLNDKWFLVHSKHLMDLPICSVPHREGMNLPISTQKELQKSDFQCIFSNSRQQMQSRYLNNNPCKNLASSSYDALCLPFLAFQVSRSNRKKYCWTALDTKKKQVRQKEIWSMLHQMKLSYSKLSFLQDRWCISV